MREIKFRAWDKEKEEMIGWETLCLNPVGFNNSLRGEGNWIAMQSTGLKDKNGKEIWEGDIVADWIGNRTPNQDTIMGNSERGIEWDDKKGGWNITVDDEVIVIGNIYEHDYLLNKSK